jgi:anti-anti-sigma regulatory factor
MPGVQCGRRGDVLVALFTKQEIRDPAEVQEVSAELLTAIEHAPAGKLLLDFRNVKFLSSEMVGQLFVLVNRCKAREVQLKACGLSDNIRLILDTVRILNSLEVHKNETDAWDAFGSEPIAGADPSEFDMHPDYLRTHAAQGDGDAEFDLAMCYEQGRGVPQNMAESVQWLRRAAEHGHAEAQYRLGMAYAYGIDVPQDYNAAVRWYHSAAEQGQADAQYALGMTYRYGLLGGQDEETAGQWYAKAAAQGHERAVVELKQSPLSNS